MADPVFSVLTAMITPAVLISGAGTLLLSTSNRLGRSTDRVRTLTARFKLLMGPQGQSEPLAAEEKRLILEQLPRLTRRTRYLHRAMQAFYLSVALLVGPDAVSSCPCHARPTSSRSCRSTRRTSPTPKAIALGLSSGPWS